MAALIKAGGLWYRRVKSSRRLYAWSRERVTATAFVGARLSVDAGLVEVVDAADGHLIAVCEGGRMQR